MLLPWLGVLTLGSLFAARSMRRVAALLPEAAGEGAPATRAWAHAGVATLRAVQLWLVATPVFWAGAVGLLEVVGTETSHIGHALGALAMELLVLAPVFGLLAATGQALLRFARVAHSDDDTDAPTFYVLLLGAAASFSLSAGGLLRWALHAVA